MIPDLLPYIPEESEKSKIQKRNTWNERKNTVLVELVKNSKYPTPWRPKHGTNKEIWQDIAERMMERTDVFDTPVHWESAKEQLMKIIDRQRLRRSLGDFSVKSETEIYVDEMIKHITADNEEKASQARRQKERAQKRLHRRSSGDVNSSDVSINDHDDSVNGDYDGSEKRARYEDGQLLQHASYLSGSFSLRSPLGVSASSIDADPLTNTVPMAVVEAVLTDRERLRSELEACKDLIKSSKDVQEQTQVGNAEALRLVQQQLAACQSVLATAHAIIAKLADNSAAAEQATHNL